MTRHFRLELNIGHDEPLPKIMEDKRGEDDLISETDPRDKFPVTEEEKQRIEVTQGRLTNWFPIWVDFGYCRCNTSLIMLSVNPEYVNLKCSNIKFKLFYWFVWNWQWWVAELETRFRQVSICCRLEFDSETGTKLIQPGPILNSSISLRKSTTGRRKNKALWMQTRRCLEWKEKTMGE